MAKKHRGRVAEWDDFAVMVHTHIRTYTLEQYGDAPNDQVEEWTPAQCIEAIKRYCNRHGKNARGKAEDLRDLRKIAHYACIAYWKEATDETDN